MKHRHRAVPAFARTYAWMHCVRPRPGRCSGAAHGNIEVVDRCACGAQRSAEANCGHVVWGSWSDPGISEQRNVLVGGRHFLVDQDMTVRVWDEVSGRYSARGFTPREQARARRAAVAQDIGAGCRLTG